MTKATGKIIAISVSEKKGFKKTNVLRARLIASIGIKGDAHAEGGNRQVSILPLGSIERMRELGADVQPGDFAENLTIEGIEAGSFEIGDVLKAGDVQLQITKIGKECHSRCVIYSAVGDCVMPRDGVFAAVIKGGELTPGMAITLEN